MKQENGVPAGSDRPRVQRVDAARAAERAYSGEMGFSGMPADVVYLRPAADPVAQPTEFVVGPNGSLRWQPKAAERAARPVGPVAEPARALARRDPRLPTVDGAAVVAARPPAAGGHAGAENGDLQKIHRLLRGRYLLAILLALVLGGAGAYAGFRYGHQTFQSTGLITITPIRMFNSGQDSQFSTEQFMQAEMAKLKSQRVLDLAMDDARWRALGRTRTDAAEAAFVKELGVTTQGQTLLVTFVDRDPDAATAAVQATMNAFRHLFETEQGGADSFTQSRWQVAENDLNANLVTIQQKIDDLAGIYGADGLAMRHTFELQEVHDIEKAINDLDVLQAQLLAAPAKAGGAPSTAPATEEPVEEIAKADMLLANLISRRAQVQQQIAEYKTDGLMAAMPRLSSAEAMLKMLDEEIAKRAADWRASHPPTPKLPLAADGSSSSALQAMTPESLHARVDYLTKRKDALNADLKGLSTQLAEIAKLRIDRERLQHDLNTAEEELQQYKFQGVKWRVDINDADRPLTVFRDTRVTFAGAGGLGGSVFGLGIVLLIGLIDRRVRDSRDAAVQYPGTPILGMLPQLPEDLADPEDAAAAAHGVHEIRTLLQIMGRGQNHQVFGVSSAGAGTGKTSLTLGLGVSFASAGFRTLVVDCDIVGGGLSRRVDAIIRRKIGQVLTRGGYINEEQLNAALALARGSGRRLGEILIELGHLTEADLGAAIHAQAEDRVGLPDALAGMSVAECIAETGIPGLRALPLGSARPEHAGALSPDALHRVLAAARRDFDVVIVDTGPMPGSLEASIVASEVDAMLLAVARGDRGPDVQRALSHLRSLNAKVAGLVFNRALAGDIERYGSSRMSSGSGRPASRGLGEAAESSRFGPVARAVASFVPPEDRASSRWGN